MSVAPFVLVCALLTLAAWGNPAEEGVAFLDTVATRKDVYRLPSGTIVKFLTKGTGAKSPRIDDDCDVHYSGTLPDGTKFDSSYDRGAPATFKPNQVIAGWTEALQLMREGDKWTIYHPFDLAYGASGSPPSIPPFSPLVFDIELIEVKGPGKPASEAQATLRKKLAKRYAEFK